MIEYLPTRIKITDFEEDDAIQIRKYLSVWDKTRFRYRFFAYKYNEEDKEIIFPGGINKYRLEKQLSDHNVVDNSRKFLINCRHNKPIKILYPPKSVIQEKAVKFLLGNSFSSKSSQKMLSLNTGEGKTYCAINYIASKKRIPLIFVDLDTLVQQWKNSILKFTDVKEDEIYVFSGIESVRKILKMDISEVNKFKFFIGIYKTINTAINKNLFLELFDKVRFTTKIFDEAHTNYEAIFNIDSITDCESIYLTATPERSDPIENKVFQNMFYDVKRFSSHSTNETVENYHNIVIVKLNSNPRIDEQEVCKNKYGFDINKFNKYIMESKYDYFYEKVIQNILLKIILKNGKVKRKTAILVGLKSMIAKFSEDLLNDLNEMKLDYSIGILTEDTKKENKEEVLNSDIIITTDKSFGKGIDVKNLECLINLVPTSSNPKIKQILGRLRKIEGKEVYFFDVLDIGFESVQVQLINKRKAYREKSKKIITLEC